MKFFKRLQGWREQNAAAEQYSKALLQDALLTDPDIDDKHEVALAQLRQATTQARKLSATDHQNHYSESLTHAFRGRTA
jgi:hypothetical protein